MSRNGLSQGYCGTGPNDEYGWSYHILSFLFIWAFSDLYQFYYHRLGHTTEIGWKQHKYHHVFYNPTPFAVVADEYLD
jgi:lathosterol oxidase